MKFIVSSADLLKKLQLLNGVIVPNNAKPILENFLFNVNNNILELTASDGETTLISSLDIESNENGKIAVPSKLLTDILKTFSAQPLTFVLKNNILEIIDENDTYQIAIEDANEYPVLPDFEFENKVELNTLVLQEAITNTLFATGNDAMRPIMTGVLFQFTPEGTQFVATDAHRLVKYTRKDITLDHSVDFILPKKPLQLLRNSLGNSESQVILEFNINNAKLTIDDTVWICRLIEGKFPNYEAVIPKENPNILTINTSLFLNSIKRAALFTNRSTHQLKLKIVGNSLNLSAEDVDYSNKADIALACDYNGEDMQIGFNSKFLSEMISNINSDDLVLEMSVPSRAGIIKPSEGLDENEEILMLVMPVMIS